MKFVMVLLPFVFLKKHKFEGKLIMVPAGRHYDTLIGFAPLV
jgi:hypothetical protein